MVSATAVAQLAGDGYYRVQNYMTKRYVYVLDDKGSLNMSTSSADMNAIQLWLGFDKASSDPATVCYIKKVDTKYDIECQGTGIYKILDTYVGIRATNSSAAPNTYLAYGSKEGITKYLSDGEHVLDAERGSMSDTGDGQWRYWYILPISSSSSDSYFGVKPVISLGGKYYTSYYTAFPYSFASSGMKAMYISKVAYGMAVLKEVTGTIPAGSPVFIECSSATPAGNKLNIGGSATAISGNVLKGVYFDNPMKTHYNRVAYNPATMRLLGVTKEGKIGFVTSDIDFVPANSAYLPVAADSPKEIKIVTEAEFNEYEKNLPTSITLSPETLVFTEGETASITATVLPAGADATLTWKSGNTNVVTVKNGVATAVAPGYATIFATTVNGLQGATGVRVLAKPVLAQSLTFDITTKEVEAGESFKITATVKPDDTTNKTLTWSSSNTAVATVDANGKVTTITPGTVQIKATTTDGSNLSATCNVTVKEKTILATSITLDATSKDVMVDDTFTLTATISPENTTNKAVTWSSNNSIVATVDANGNVTAKAIGTATITATTADGSNLSASCIVKVSRRVVRVTSLTFDITSKEVEVGESFTITATVKPDDAANKALTWSSSNSGVAIVNQSGKVTALTAGTVQISAVTSDGSNLKATCNVTVKAKPVPATSLTFNITSKEVEAGDEFTITATVKPTNATNKVLAWSSSNTAVATVDANGKVTTLTEGNAEIKAVTTDGTNLTATCAVTVKPRIVLATSITLNKAEVGVEFPSEFTLIATVKPDNTTNKTVKWSSSNEAIATVDNNGNVKVTAAGKVYIYAETTDGSNLKATCEVNAASGVEMVFANSNTPVDVFNLQGVLIKKAATREDIRHLTPGMYIVGGIKVIITSNEK